MTKINICLISFALCIGSAFAQSGPLGRAARATQVVADSDSFALLNSSGGVLQGILERADTIVTNQADRISKAEVDAAELASSRTILLKGAYMVEGGQIIENPANTYTIYFNPGSGTSGGSTNNTSLISGCSTLPPGSVIAWTMDTVPSGWLLCNGASINTNSYPDLFSAIGWRYSSSTGTTFNVPDYRGIVLRGATTSILVDPGVSNRVASGLGGTYATAGSYQAGTVCTSAVSGVEARLPNRYVNWLIKYRDDTKYFVSSASATLGTNFVASITNGTLNITYPPSSTNSTTTRYISSTWTSSSISANLDGSVSQQAPATTNRTVFGYGVMSDYGEKYAVWYAKLSANGTDWTTVQIQQSAFYSVDISRLSIAFDVPAGYYFKVDVVNSAPNLQPATTYTIVWKP